VDVADNPIGGNHLKGEATIKTAGDAVKYNAIGIQGTDLAGETGNELMLNQPITADGEEPVGQYNACPNVLILNHFAEGATDPFILASGHGGTCSSTNQPCQTDADCDDGHNDQRITKDFCVNGSQIEDEMTGHLALRSATVTDLTLIPCTQDFENGIPTSVTVQFDIVNEFEQHLSTSTTVTCWLNNFLFEIGGITDPNLSPFSIGSLGTTVASTRITPILEDGGVLGVAGVTRADAQGNLTRAALNIHMEGDRFSGTGGEVIDVITLSDLF
jgi:hypothetical protein